MPTTPPTTQAPRRTSTSPAAAGSLIVASMVLLAAVGFGLGSLVGQPVLAGLVGLFAGVVVGIVLVIRRFETL